MPNKLNKILLVDDDEIVSEFAVMIMEGSGFEVLYCDSGAKALEEAVAFDPQLILLDVIMPGMEGPEVLQELRKIPETSSTPVIFLTGKANPEDEKKYMGMGALGLIAKPFEPNTLCDKINALWEKSSG